MKSNKAKERSIKSKTQPNYLAIRAAEAKKQAQAARQSARAAKTKFKAARKAFKLARKLAKQARKEARLLAKALKAQNRPAAKAANKGSRQRRPKLEQQKERANTPRIIVQKPTTPTALARTEIPAGPETGRSQLPKVGT
jgi:hypothetical protein